MKSKKEIVRKSELLAQIRADLKAWEEAEQAAWMQPPPQTALDQARARLAGSGGPTHSPQPWPGSVAVEAY